MRSATVARTGAAHRRRDEAARKYRVKPEHLPQALAGIVARLDELGGSADLAELARQEAAAREEYLSQQRN